MKKEVDNMSEKKEKPVIIEGNTQIVFTVKAFIGTIMTILGIFASFYFMVFLPREEKTETYQKELYNQQLTYISNEFIKVNSTIRTTNSALEALTNRFNDLNNVFIQNSGGSLSNNVNHNNGNNSKYYYDESVVTKFETGLTARNDD